MDNFEHTIQLLTEYIQSESQNLLFFDEWEQTNGFPGQFILKHNSGRINVDLLVDYGGCDIEAYFDNRKVPVRVPGEEYVNRAHNETLKEMLYAIEKAIETRIKNAPKNKKRREEAEERRFQQRYRMIQSRLGNI